MDIETKKIIHRIYSGMENLLRNLYARWQDESDLEAWDEYKRVITKEFEILSEPAVFVRTSKRPFGLTYDCNGYRVKLTMTSKQYNCVSTKVRR